MNYLSLWIANFGVVPWFSFLFFLLRPIFLSFKALLVFVCCVLEAITYSFAKINHSKGSFLSLLRPDVKVFFLIYMISGHCLADQTSASKEYFLAKGEQIELVSKEIMSFSVGNKEVLQTKYYPPQSQLLIKGRSLGFSDIVVWGANKKKTTYHFYVVSKKEQVQALQMANDFKSLGVKVKVLAQQILLEGQLEELRQYKLFRFYMQRHEQRAIDMVTLSDNLRQELIAKIYMQLAHQATNLVCQAVNSTVTCHYDHIEHEEKRNELQALYHVKFAHRSPLSDTVNYKIELKVFKTDRSEVSRIGIGLNQLGAQVAKLLNDGPLALIEGNEMIFSEKELQSRVISSPALLTSMNTPGQIRLGADIPVVSQNQFGQQTTWRFAGLKMTTQLSRVGGKLHLKLENELTHPVENLIRGNKSRTQFFVKEGAYTAAFQVNYQMSSSGESSIPGLNKVALIKRLFGTHSQNKTEQWLLGFVRIVKER